MTSWRVSGRVVRTTGLFAAAVFTLGALSGCAGGDSASSSSASASVSGSASSSQYNQQGEAAANEFFSLLQRQDTAGLDTFLSPAFQVVRADGSASNKAEYLADPPKVAAYEISDVDTTVDGNIMVVRYTVTTKETIDEELYFEDPRPRLSVFVKSGDTWQLIGHANLNSPEGATPEAVPTPLPSASNPASPADTEIAEATQNAFFAALQDGDLVALDQLLSPAFQLVRADGSTADKMEYMANPARMDSFELTDFVVSRDGDVIVARFNGSTQEVIDGQTYGGTAAPRFAVMVKEGDTWRIVGQVNFNLAADGGASASPTATAAN